VRYFLSLGSNLGNREENLALAREYLRKRGVKIIHSSSIYETQPRDYLEQPWFLNQVIEIETNLFPFALLKLIKKIENELGRKKGSLKGPRKIDIDILLAEGCIIDAHGLKIPHPRLEERNFVLIPLKEISPNIIHPILRKKIEYLCNHSKDSSKVNLVKKISQLNE